MVSGSPADRYEPLLCDGVTLMSRWWERDAARAQVLIVHGLAEHIGRYEHVAATLTAQGFACAGIDCRGHGRSGGRRGHVSSFDEYLADVATLREAAQVRHPGRPIFLLGHSQGGLVALLSSLSDSEHLAGCIVTAPMLEVHPSTRPAAPLRALASLAARVSPTISLPAGLDATLISRDPRVVEAYVGDPFVFRRVTAGWYVASLRAMAEVWRLAPQLAVPLLAMSAGADQLTNPEAVRRWVSLAGGPGARAVAWPGLRHEILNEPEREEVLERVVAWLREQVDS